MLRKPESLNYGLLFRNAIVYYSNTVQSILRDTFLGQHPDPAPHDTEPCTMLCYETDMNRNVKSIFWHASAFPCSQKPDFYFCLVITRISVVSTDYLNGKKVFWQVSQEFQNWLKAHNGFNPRISTEICPNTSNLMLDLVHFPENV